jgi:hypothetical protein
VDILEKYSPKGWKAVLRAFRASFTAADPGDLRQTTTRRNLLDAALGRSEDRLTDEQWEVYRTRLELDGPKEIIYWKRAIHATPSQKIDALAAVILNNVDGK